MPRVASFPLDTSSPGQSSAGPAAASPPALLEEGGFDPAANQELPCGCDSLGRRRAPHPLHSHTAAVPAPSDSQNAGLEGLSISSMFAHARAGSALQDSILTDRLFLEPLIQGRKTDHIHQGTRLLLSELLLPTRALCTDKAEFCFSAEGLHSVFPTPHGTKQC